jgi:hypothetical protein
MSETWLDSSRPFKFGELVYFKVYRSIAVTVVREMRTVLRQMRWGAAGHEHSLPCWRNSASGKSGPISNGKRACVHVKSGGGKGSRTAEPSQAF